MPRPKRSEHERIINPDILASARRGTQRAGKADLIKHLTGKDITMKHAIMAKCYDCNGLGELSTCDIDECPLRPYSQWGHWVPGDEPVGGYSDRNGI